MKIRSVLNALFGLWFLFTPWLSGYTDPPSVIWIYGIVGAVQAIAASAALCMKKGDSPPNLLTLITGIAMVVIPFTGWSLPLPIGGISIILGIVTMLFSFANLGARK
ncbi:SPW repeat protein [Paenibacillus sp. NPDC056579]|uniref:SPW repeat domain-containing protein n=1 Tax=Paenibacillus sp. NPDC056579 TaxID=3345871 RepID=UPI00368DFE9B